VAAKLKKEFGVDAELIEGDRGEFTVWVEKHLVAKKGLFGFPSDQKVLAAVQKVL